MKTIILLCLVAFVCAVPVDDKKTAAAPQKPLTPLTTGQSLPSKSASAPAAAAAPSKPKRDTNKQAAPQPAATPQKNAAASSSTSTQVKKTNAAPAPAPASNVNRKTRETQKTPTVDAVKPAQASNIQKAPTPQVAKVPLTNSRQRRDAPKPAEQSKIVPSATNYKPADSAVKANNAPAATSTVIKPKRDTINSQLSSSSSNGQSIKRPAPVDQVLKQKTAPAPVAPATDAKPIVKS